MSVLLYPGSIIFNTFIEPMKAKTLNIGFNYFSNLHKFKTTLFFAKIDDEIYYNPNTWKNTNIDETSKKGIEVFDKYQINQKLISTLNYSYIDAKIEKDSNNQIENKVLPGVSKHNLSLSFEYQPRQKISLLLLHKYKSKSYALNDFQNNFSQKTKEYQRTDLSAKYYYKKDISLFALVQNIFEEKNGIWVYDNAIYPIDFERKLFVGLKAKF